MRLTLCLICGGLLAAALVAGEPREVAFNANGFWIQADYYGPTSSYRDAAMVILLHAEGGGRTDWAPLIQPLQEAGFVVLVPDLRGHGGSATSKTRDQLERRDPQLFRDMLDDLHGAYDWLAKQKGGDRARFALVGAGSGAGLAISYAATDRSVDAIVCLSPPTDTPGLDLMGDLGQTRGRKILLLAGEDQKDACDRLARHGDGVKRHLIAEATRGTDMLGEVPGIKKKIADFLIRGVGSPSKTVVFGSKKSNVYHTADSGWLDRIAPSNLRHYSSPQEAKARGLRPSKSRGPRKQSAKPERRQRPPQPEP